MRDANRLHCHPSKIHCFPFSTRFCHENTCRRRRHRLNYLDASKCSLDDESTRLAGSNFPINGSGMKIQFILTLFVLSALLAVHARASEDDIPWEKLKSAGEHYLEVCVSKQVQTSMAKKMRVRVEQRVKDTGVSSEQAAREIMFDWAVDNRVHLERKEPKALAQVCFYFVMFVRKQFSISPQIKSDLTPSLCNEILDFLDEEVKKKTTL